MMSVLLLALSLILNPPVQSGGEPAPQIQNRVTAAPQIQNHVDAAPQNRAPSARNHTPVVFAYTEYDFGKVEAKNGILYHSFTFANTSRDTLRLEMPSVSCDCLTAEVSPNRLAPGERGEVKVKLNPAGTSGRIMRTVGLRTVDRMELATLVLTADVTPPYPEIESICPVPLSNSIRASVEGVRFGYLYWDEGIKQKYFLLANTSSKEVSLEIGCTNPELFIDAPESIKPGETAEVTVWYQFDSQQYRSENDVLEILTDGRKTGRNINVSCIRMARLPERAEAKSAESAKSVKSAKSLQAPKSPSLQTYPSVGKLKKKLFSSLREGSIEISNKGQETLHILAVQGTANTNLSAPATLAPGETFIVRLQTAKDEAKLELFTDDPQRPYKELIFKL